VNRKFKFLRRRIREKFLKFHLDRNVNGFEAANALGDRGCVDVGGHQNAVVKALEAQIHRNGVTLVDVGDAFTPTLDELLVEVDFALVTDAVRDVKHADDEGVGWVIFHPLRLPAI
jgi:hypothetical protein